MKLDNIDATILSELTINACASQVELAERVGLFEHGDRPDGRRCWRKKVSSVAIRPFWIWRASVSPPPFWSGSPWKVKTRRR